MCIDALDFLHKWLVKTLPVGLENHDNIRLPSREEKRELSHICKNNK
jgi:hypothetical protein